MELQKHYTMTKKQSVARQILEDAKFKEDQAVAIITTVNLATEDLATKDDVEELRNEMLKEFKLSDQRTDNKFEKMRNQLDANANSTNAKFDKMDAKFDKMDAKLDKMDAKFDKMDAKFDKMDAKFDKMDAKFDKNDARFDQIESKFKNLTLRLVAAVVSAIVTLGALYTALTKFFAG